MTVYFQHVGEQGAARDFPRTIGTRKTGLVRFQLDEIQSYLASLTPYGGTELQVIAQGLLIQVSTRLNEAGNNTSTTRLPPFSSNLRQEISLRHSASGVSHALVITAKRVTLSSGIPREIEVEAVLLDANNFERQWEFEYVDRHASGDAVPKTSQALIKALRESGFVK
jgi:hypothetical protein